MAFFVFISGCILGCQSQSEIINQHQALNFVNQLLFFPNPDVHLQLQMRNYIIYFLTSLFLLFVVVSKTNVRTFKSCKTTTHASHHWPKKANHLNQTFEKLSIQQASDDSGNNTPLELSENDFQFPDTLQTVIVFASVFASIYLIGLRGYERLKSPVYDFIVNTSTVKRFILIRSIRI